MKKILCIFGIHKWDKWIYVGDIGRYKERLRSKCIHCNKIKIYEGFTEKDIITGERNPYIFK